MALTKYQATAIGLVAPVLWGMSVGIVRAQSEISGPFLGMALVFTICFLGLFFTYPSPKITEFRLSFLLLGVGVSVLGEICFALSLYLCEDGIQTIEVGMVNYLWPSMIIVFAICFNGQKASLWVIPGTLIALAGIVKILAGEHGFQIEEMASRIAGNPAAYALGLGSALGWSGYCSISKALADGKNPIVIIYGFNSVAFWILAFCFQDVGQTISGEGLLYALFCALVFGSSFVCWTTAVAKGSITLLGLASYFTPVLSCVFSSFWLNATLSLSFWIGVALVVAGSLLSWYATRGDQI